MKHTGSDEKKWPRIDIELCCARSCPIGDCERARQELEEALSYLGWTIGVTVKFFQSEKELMNRDMSGSPALCVDGRDLFFEFPIHEVGVRCRVYADRGEVAPCPTRKMIRKALLRDLILRAFGRKR